MLKRSIVTTFLLLMVSCSSSRMVLVQPEDLEAHREYKNNRAKYTLFTTDQRKIELDRFEIKADTLILLPAKQAFYNPEMQKIPFDQIRKIVTVEYPERTSNISKIIFGVTLLPTFFLLLFGLV